MKTILDYADLVKEQHALNTTIAPVETDLTSASQAYAVGQKFIYDGVLYQAKTAIAQGAALVLNTNYEAADDVSTEIEALTNKLNNEIVTRSALSAKNILPFDLAEIKALNTNGTWAGNVYTYRGVAFTVNSDGTISATGTATGGNASIKLFAASSNYEMLGKEVILTGCPSNGSASTYRIQAYRMASADGSTGTYFDDGAGTDAFTVLNDASGTVGSFAVAVYENATVTNLLFKPMVRLASDPDATYQPYAKTNRELTAENQTLTNKLDDEVETRAKLGAHNWLGGKFTSQTLNNIVFNALSDGMVTASGTASATASTIASSSWVLKAGTYILSGNPLPAATGKHTYISLVKKSDTSTFVAAENSESKSFTLAEDTEIFARVSCQGNGETFDVVFKPMIRLASDAYATYTPYAMTNSELTEKAIITDVSGYSWDSAIDGTKDIIVKRYGAIVSVYGYFRSTNALAQYANVLSGLPHCASGAALSTDIAHNMGMTLQHVDNATSKFVVNSATTADLQYAFNFVYLTDN